MDDNQIQSDVNNPDQQTTDKRLNLIRYLYVVGALIILAGSGFAIFYWVYYEKEDQPAKSDVTTQIQEGGNCEGDNCLIQAIQEDQVPEDAGVSGYSKEDKSVDAYGAEKIKEHGVRDDCWIVFDYEIYDVSQWSYTGTNPIDSLCGEIDGAIEHFEADGVPKPPAHFFKGVFPRSGIT